MDATRKSSEGQRHFIRLTLLISILFGIILPLDLGVKDPTLITFTFSTVWFLYAVVMFIMVFLVKPGLKIKESAIRTRR